MAYKCDECDSTFREKKNLQQHMRKDHGLKKYKCDHCNYHSDDRSNVLKHQKDEKSYLIQQRLVILEQIIFLLVKSSSSPYWPARREN